MMALGIGMLLLALLLFAPLTLRAALCKGQTTSGQLCLQVWGIPFSWAFRTSRENGKLQWLVRGERKHAKEHPAPPVEPKAGEAVLHALLHPGYGRKYLVHHLHLVSLRGQVLLSTRDAAGTALCSGLLLFLRPFLPPGTSITVLPDFWSGVTTLALRGVIETRLMHLLGAALCFGLGMLRQKIAKHKEGLSWIIPLGK